MEIYTLIVVSSNVNFDSYSKENNLYAYIYYVYSLTRVLWSRHSQRSGEIDTVEGIALAMKKVGGGAKAAS